MIQHTAQAEAVKVAARTLAQMLTREECRRARLIKVDVEGVEGRTIRGLELERDCFDVRLDGDSRREGGSNKADDLLHHRLQPSDNALLFLLAAECQNAPHQIARTIAGAQHFVHAFVRERGAGHFDF